MRIIAIGLGGAGCRIADSLYSIDRRSSRVACIQSLAVDVDEQTLQQLTEIPDTSKVYFPPFDPGNPALPEGSAPTATIDIGEIVSRTHNFESGENDAIFICCGLGGRMTDIIPHVIAGLRASIPEPIFGLVTLPCLAEGENRSSKAADDIDILFPLLDGMILFDNETWYKKARTRPAEPARNEKGITGIFGFGKEEQKLSPEMETYRHLNDAIVRRISLILKAGEFNTDGGIDHAEVVLDSGEVLNTMKGGGFITIGYAVEKLPKNPLAFLATLKPAGLFNEESKKRASRIVELAKQAIYHEVSTPCDMTSAHKALVLVAGPSHEISMQGFMTVRKWIDRSISGIEMRSGDYPVMNTANVAVIIMFSGLENIPRVSELREIREQTRHGPVQRSLPDEVPQYQVSGMDAPIKDEMITLPASMQKYPGFSRRSEEISRTDNVHISSTNVQTRPAQQIPLPRESLPESNTPPQPSGYTPVRRPLISEEGVARIPDPGYRQVAYHTPSAVTQNPYVPPQKLPVQRPLPPPTYPPNTPRISTPVQSPEQSKQKIELELQRQRMMAHSGSGTSSKPQATSPMEPPITRQNEFTKETLPVHGPVHEQTYSSGGSTRTPEPKRVIIRKRTPIQTTPDSQSHEHPPQSGQSLKRVHTDVGTSSSTISEPQPGSPKTNDILVKDPAFRAKDAIFAGKEVRASAIPKVRDDALLDSGLKPKKSVHYNDGRTIVSETGTRDEDFLYESSQEKNIKKRDDRTRI